MFARRKKIKVSMERKKTKNKKKEDRLAKKQNAEQMILLNQLAHQQLAVQ